MVSAVRDWSTSNKWNIRRLAGWASVSTSALLVLLLMFWSGQPFGWIAHHSNASRSVVRLWVIPTQLGVIAVMTGGALALGIAMWRNRVSRISVVIALIAVLLSITSLVVLSAGYARRAAHLVDQTKQSWQSQSPDSLWAQYQKRDLDRDTYLTVCTESVVMNIALFGKRYRCRNPDLPHQFIGMASAEALGKKLHKQRQEARDTLYLFSGIAALGVLLSLAMALIGARWKNQVLKAFGGIPEPRRDSV